MKLNSYLKIGLILFILSTESTISLSTLKTHFTASLKLKRNKKSKRNHKTHKRSKTKSASDNFKNFKNGFTLKAVSSAGNCFNEAFKDNGKIEDDAEIKNFDLYSDLKSQAEDLVKKLINISENVTKNIKLKDSFCVGETDPKIDIKENLKSYSKFYYERLGNIENNYSPNKKIDFPKMNTDKSSFPEVAEIYNFAVKAAENLSDILCGSPYNIVNYYKIALTNLKLSKVAIKEDDVEQFKKEVDKKENLIKKVENKISYYLGILKGFLKDIYQRLKDYFKCLTTEEGKSEASSILWKVLDGTVSVIANMLPVIGPLIFIYRLIVTFFSFFKIGKLYYDGYKEKNKEIKYNIYGKATYKLCSSLLYLFTGVKLSIMSERKLKRINRIERFVSFKNHRK